MTCLARIGRALLGSAGTFAGATAIALTAASSLGDGDPRPSAAARRAAIANPAPAIVATSAAPADLHVEATETPAGIVVRAARPGQLVALLGGRARQAGASSAELTVDLAALDDAAATEALARGVVIAWETSPLGELAVERGLVSLARRDHALHAEVSLAAPPRTLSAWSGQHHACEAHDAAFGGYVVLCRLDKAARDVAAASLTNAWPHDDVVVSHGPRAAIVRFDLPLALAGDAPQAASAVASFHVGRTGFVIDVDATRVPGEPSAIALAAASRDQPIASDEDPRAAAALGNKQRAFVSTRVR